MIDRLISERVKNLYLNNIVEDCHLLCHDFGDVSFNPVRKRTDNRVAHGLRSSLNR